jgi:two-component system nitrate/nitrite response regulator NarL
MTESTATSAIRVMLADDHPSVLEAIEQQVQRESDLTIVATCARGEQVVPLVRQHHPDVLVLGFMLNNSEGLELLRALREETYAPRTILVSGQPTEEEMLEAVRRGARGVLLRDMAARVIAQCVRKVHSGGEWLEQETAARAMRTLLRRESGEREAARLLTNREIEVVRQVAQGLRNKEVAGKLNITEGTVKIHLHNIYEKTGVGGRVALSTWAKEKGLV